MANIVQAEKAFVFDAQHPKVKKFFKDSQNKFKMRLYQLANVPGAVWFRLRVEEVSEEKTVVSIPLGWRTQNPFKSIYFVGLLAAAEYSSAIFAYSRVMMAKDVLLIVKDVQADFIKKASGRTYFTCNETAKIDEAVNLALITGEQQSVTFNIIGKLADGKEVAKTRITWTFKQKKKK